MKEGKKNKFRCTVFMKLILDTPFILWRPPKIYILHGGKIEHYLIFQNLTLTCHGPTAENHIKSMVTPNYFFFLLVQKNIYSQSPLCTRSLTRVLAEIWFFKSLDRGCRTKGPLLNLGRLTVDQDVHIYQRDPDPVPMKLTKMQTSLHLSWYL